MSALDRHRRQHAHRAGMGVPGTQNDRLGEAVALSTGNAHTRAMGVPPAMPRCVHDCDARPQSEDNARQANAENEIVEVDFVAEVLWAITYFNGP